MAFAVAFPNTWPDALAVHLELAVAPEGERLRHAMRLHLGPIWRLLRRVGLSPPDADEAAQDVFLVLARRVTDVPVPAERSFLMATAVRVAADRRRQLATRPATALLDEPPSPDLPAAELLALRRARATLDEALDTLTPD